MPAKPEILYGLFCENARSEPGGKTTAIGIWGSRCVFVGPPPGRLVTMGVYFYLMNRGQIPFEVDFQLVLPNIPPVLHHFTLTTVPNGVGNNIIMNFGGLVFNEPGVVKATLTVLADEPVTKTIELEVTFRDE